MTAGRSRRPVTDVKDFSNFHKAIAWRGFHAVVYVPGISFLYGHVRAGFAILALLCIACLLGPLIRLLFRKHSIFREEVFAMAIAYVVIALTMRFVPVLVLPFLVGYGSIFLIMFSRKMAIFQREVLELKDIP